MEYTKLGLGYCGDSIETSIYYFTATLSSTSSAATPTFSSTSSTTSNSPL